MSKELCECGNFAVWVYMPGYSSGNHPYFCNDCVHRGCSCNHKYINEVYTNNPEGEEGIDWKWIEEGLIWTYIDEKSREYPCAEYEWDPDGYEREINPHMLN
jgi:hypothetical protein